MNKHSHLFCALQFVFGVVSCNSESIAYNFSITNLSDDTVAFSKNFLHWEIIANGPIRSVFKPVCLLYDAGGFSVNEHTVYMAYGWLNLLGDAR